jgi:hypothetical protein
MLMTSNSRSRMIARRKEAELGTFTSLAFRTVVLISLTCSIFVLSCRRWQARLPVSIWGDAVIPRLIYSHVLVVAAELVGGVRHDNAAADFSGNGSC